MKELKTILINCLEEHYGSLSNLIVQEDWSLDLLKKIDGLINNNRKKLYN